MPAFDRINGVFTTRFANGKSGVKSSNERFPFKRNGWTWNSRRKGWETADVEKARPLAKFAVGAAKEYLTAAERVRQAAVASSWAEDTDTSFPAPQGLSYLPFQKAGIEYAASRPKTLIADPPGLGKTIQAIGVHNAVKTNRVLVICPASLKVNWKREWEKWDVHGLSVGIAQSVTKREPIFDEEGVRMRDHNNKPMSRTWTEHVWPDTDVVVINYDMLYSFDEEVKDVEWDLMICDEAHLLKTKTAVRTMCVFGGEKKARKQLNKETNRREIVEHAKTLVAVEAKRSLFLTGTPILSKPIELWNLIRVCDPKGLGRSWDDFAFDYCGAYYDGNFLDTSGASNSEELNRLMRERFMVRRDKRAVLKELPDKTRELIMLPQDKLEAPVKRELSRMETALAAYEDLVGISETERQFRYIKAIDDLSDKLQAALDAQDREDPNWDEAVKSLDEPDQILFTEISLAREEVALAKVGLVVDHVKKLLDADEPVILFAYHKSVIAEIQKRLEAADISVGIVTGAVPSKKRQQVVDDFQDGKHDVILGNILAMGVGFTLTRARFVVFAELDWVPALIEQAEDRAWRHGQVNAVLVQHLVVDGSIESRMAIALLDKMGVIHATLDSRDTPLECS